jgi:hypothetical protein
MLRWVMLVMLAVAALWPHDAAAEALDPAGAEALFQKGRDAMVLEDYDAACQFFAESLALDQAVGTVMNLATCEEKRGHLTASWERWHQALRLLDPHDDRVLFAEDQLNSISARLAHLTVRLSGASPKDVTIRRDGVILGAATLGQDLPVDPGTHVVTVEGKRYEPRSYTVTLASGESGELAVGPGAAKPLPRQTPNDRSLETRRIAAYASLGVGAVGLAAAIVTGLLLPAQDQKVEENCPNKVCNDVGAQALADARLLLGLNTAGWITAGVGVAAGSVLFITTLPKGKKSADARKGAPGAQSRKEANQPKVTSINLTGSGVLLRGTF